MRLYPLLGRLTQWFVDYCMWASSCCVIPWEVYSSINILDTWCFFKAFLVLEWLAWFYVHLIACYCWSIKNLAIILFPTTLSMSTAILTLRHMTFLFFWTVIPWSMSMAEILTFNEQGGNILTEYLFQIPNTILAWMWCNLKKVKRNNDIKQKAMLQSFIMFVSFQMTTL